MLASAQFKCVFISLHWSWCWNINHLRNSWNHISIPSFVVRAHCFLPAYIFYNRVCILKITALEISISYASRSISMRKNCATRAIRHIMEERQTWKKMCQDILQNNVTSIYIIAYAASLQWKKESQGKSLFGSNRSILRNSLFELVHSHTAQNNLYIFYSYMIDLIVICNI